MSLPLILQRDEKTIVKLLFSEMKLRKGLFHEKTIVNTKIWKPESHHVTIMDGRRSSVRLILISVLNIHL